VSRRDFLAAGSLTMVGLSMAERAAVLRAQERSGPRSVILVVMNGGPSQLETFDPKPDVPNYIRGPLRAIQTAIPGVRFGEGLPQLAARADRFSIIRSLYHDATPSHEAGMQLLCSGRLTMRDSSTPSLGAVAARLLGPRGRAPAYALLPGDVSETGTRAETGLGPGWLGEDYSPYVPDSGDDGNGEDPALVDVEHKTISTRELFQREPVSVRERYGESRFGELLWRAERLVETGVRVVVVNLCPKLYGEVTFDAHAHRTAAPATVFDYRDTIGPQFDRACSALLDDLHDSGLLGETLVVATGEFGRTPQVNGSGGRDHWPHCWSGLIAGGGLPAGGVIGASDRSGERPAERPISLPELVATIYDFLRIDPRSTILAGEVERRLLDAEAVAELAG
jgi:uncharacterized protein (DUF1501 family)